MRDFLNKFLSINFHDGSFCTENMKNPKKGNKNCDESHKKCHSFDHGIIVMSIIII